MPYGKLTDKELNEIEDFNLELYNVKQVAVILDISTRTVMKYVYNGSLKGQKIGGKWKFTREAIENFVKGK